MLPPLLPLQLMLPILIGLLFSLFFASPVRAQETSITLDIQIDSSRDDAEESLESKRVRTDSSDLELVHDVDAGEKQLVGLRFDNVQIPQGADILEAVVQFQVDEPDAGAIHLDIAGELENDAASFRPRDRNLSNRRQTQATVNWTPPVWNTVGQAGPDQQTPDLSTIIQEIVDRQGWQYGNALALLISGNGGSGTRVADSYDGSAKRAPLLQVTYSVDTDDNASAHGFKVAFIGDQGINDEAKAVLDMIAAERADMVLHLGDLGYGEGSQMPQQWEDQINAILGSDFPYVSLLGNHDVADWRRYQKKIQERLDRVGIVCEGELGIQSICSYQGLSLLLLAPHQSAGQAPFEPYVSSEETAAYIEDQLQADTAIWRVCAWHHTQNAMQVGNKRDEAGWQAYEACRKAGAIIATAHEHSYARTKTLMHMEDRIVDPVWPDRNNLLAAPGSTFAFVSGLGGRSIRPQRRCLPKTYPYGCEEWASIYAQDQAGSSGGGGGAGAIPRNDAFARREWHHSLT